MAHQKRVQADLSPARSRTPGASEEASKRARASIARPEALTIECLPRDLLCEIFSYAPQNAVLRAISPVCKRWRSAALASVTSFSFILATTDAAVLGAALALLPSLTDLELDTSAGFYTLPTTLRRLKMSARYCTSLGIAAARGLPTFLSARFPNLTELSLIGGIDQRPLMPFLRCHASQLRRLKIIAAPSQDLELAALDWANLVDFHGSRSQSIVAMLPSAKSLQRLSVSLEDDVELRELPDECLARVAAVTLWYPPTDDCFVRLGRCCPQLISLKVKSDCDPPFPQAMLQHAALFSRALRHIDVDLHDWEWLTQFRALSHVSVPAPCPLLPSPAPLPSLTTVTLGSAEDLLHVADGLLFAAYLLRVQPHIRVLRMYLDTDNARMGNELHGWVRRTGELITLAASLSVRLVAIHCPVVTDILPAERAEEFGWIRVLTDIALQ